MSTLSKHLMERDTLSIQKILNQLSSFEIADAISQKNTEDQVFVLGSLSPEFAAQVFEYLSVRAQKNILQELPSLQAANILLVMSPDDRTALLEELPRPIVDEYINLLPNGERRLAVELLGYPENSIGRLMTPDYLAVKMDWTIEQVLAHIRSYGHDSETINVIYVIDDNGVLIDDLRIKELLFVSPNAKIRDITDRSFLALFVYDKAESAIDIFKKHDRVALPVIDEDGVIKGIVTIDDILRLASEKNTENFQKIGGMEALEGPYMDTPFLELMKKRSRWLVVLFLGEMFTATAMGFFEAEISKAVVLALFLPLIISSGGNAGSQSSTLIIRAMALGEVKLKDWFRIMKREIWSGIFLGCVLGCVGFARVTVWSAVTDLYGEHWFLVATTIALSLIGVVLWGSLSGSMLPLLLRRLGIDPATSSAPLVATLVDVTGIIIYFCIALFILKGSLL